MTTSGSVGRGRLSRQDFLKLGGAGLAGAALLASPAKAFAQTGEYIEYREHAPGRFSGGTFTSGIIGTSIAFDTLIPSWNARMPSGSSLAMEVRVRYGGRWSGWLSMGRYSVSERSASASTSYPNWRVDVDTIRSRNGKRADAYQYRLTASGVPRAGKVAAVVSQSAHHGDKINAGDLQRAWGRDLPVPRRSQYAYDGAGEAWCSPTSVNMLMGYWAARTSDGSLKESVPRTARGVYDASYRGWGNWSFNVAYAAARGLESSVSRFNHVQQLERWIDAGIPVVASVAWDNRTTSERLDNAAITWSDGHLLVVRGFTHSGNVITNDPAGSSAAQVRRVYKREQFNRAWQTNGSGGVVYLIRPAGQRIPGGWAANGSW